MSHRVASRLRQTIPQNSGGIRVMSQRSQPAHLEAIETASGRPGSSRAPRLWVNREPGWSRSQPARPREREGVVLRGTRLGERPATPKLDQPDLAPGSKVVRQSRRLSACRGRRGRASAPGGRLLRSRSSRNLSQQHRDGSDRADLRSDHRGRPVSTEEPRLDPPRPPSPRPRAPLLS
jgi:hypothetical protein